MMLRRMMMAATSGGGGIAPVNRLDVTPSSINPASTTHNINMPATVGVGDLLLAQIAALSPGTITTPSGWTLLEALTVNTVTTGVYYKIADGTEGGTTVNWATANSTEMAADVHRIEAGSFTPGLISTFAVSGGASSAFPNPPQIPFPWGESTNTCIAMFASQFNSAPSSFPSGYSEGRGTPSNTPTGEPSVCQVGSAIKAAISGLSEDPSAFTISTSRQWVGQTVLISPGGLPAFDAPVLLSQQGQYFSTNTTAHNVNMPATVNAGDLLLLVFANHFTSTPTTPAGWTQLFQDVGGAVQTTTAYYKIAEGTEGGTTVNVVTSDVERATAYVARIQAGTFDSGTPPEAGAVNSGTSDAPLANPVTPSWGLADTLYIAVVGSDNIRAPTGAAVLGYPGGAFNASGQAGSISTSASVYAANMVYRAAASWPAQLAITNSQTWTARTIAIKPAP